MKLLTSGKYLKRELLYQNARCCTQSLTPIRLFSYTSSLKKTQVQEKLKTFLATGETKRYSKDQHKRKIKNLTNSISRKIRNNGYSLQKACLIIKSSFHDVEDYNDGSLSLQSLSPSSLRKSSKDALHYFEKILKLSKITKRKIDKRVYLSLLGVTEAQIKDEFAVTANVKYFLKVDDDITRAVTLIKLSEPSKSSVAMNVVHAFLLEKGDMKRAFKTVSDRKKWAIPANEHTYAIIFEGVSKSHKWGEVSDDIAEKCIRLYQDINAEGSKKENLDRIDPSTHIVAFNACLSILVKNFTDEQKYAWRFFDNLISEPKKMNLVPNTHTFTIFLDGLKRYYYHLTVLKTKDRYLPRAEKHFYFLKYQGSLVLLAQMVLQKLYHYCTPPVCPTKSDVQNDPELLIQYKKEARKVKSSLDQVFATVFLSCYINKMWPLAAGHSSSHYQYVQQALQYLRMWSPDVNELLTRVDKGFEDLSKPIKATESIVSKTDLAVKNVLRNDVLNQDHKEFSIEEYLPVVILGKKILTMDEVNPWVIFPPHLFSKNKTKAIFSDKKRLLIDWTRPSLIDIERVYRNKVYRDTKGKYGKKLSAAQLPSVGKKEALNKYILQILLDGLISLGRKKDYLNCFYQALNSWGGVDLPSHLFEQISNLSLDHKGKNIHHGLSSSLLKGKENLLQTNNISSSTRSLKEIPPYKAEIIDVTLIESFLSNLSLSFKNSASYFATYTFSAIMDPSINVHGALTPNGRILESVLNVFDEELKDMSSLKNKSDGSSSQRVESGASAMTSLSKDQLEFYLNNFNTFLETLKLNTHDELQYDKIHSFYGQMISRIYRLDWSNFKEKEKVLIHKLILKSRFIFSEFPGSDHQSIPNLNSSLNYLIKHMNDDNFHDILISLKQSNCKLLNAQQKDQFSQFMNSCI